MTERLFELDQHRGTAAQIATEIRRMLVEVEVGEKALRERQRELEAQLVAAPAATWPEVADKARYLLKLFAETPIAQDARRKKLIASVLDNFTRLSESDAREQAPSNRNGFLPVLE
jgi:hypothetical protein